MKIALAQTNPTVGDFPGNSARILEFSRRAKLRGADLVVFSELALCGYPPLDLVERPEFLARNRSEIEALAGKLAIPAIVGYVGQSGRGGEEEPTGKPATNSAALIADGRILFEQQKMLLPTYDVFDESRFFQPANNQHIFDFCGEQLGVTVCEDLWNDKNFWAQPMYARDPVTELVGRGTTLLVNISASPFTLGKRKLRSEMLQALAERHKRPVIYVNQVGGNDGLVFDGSSMAVTRSGKIAAMAGAFEEDLIQFDTTTGTGEVRPQPSEQIETVYSALVLGTRDYVKKSGLGTAVIGLSGGIDSAVVTCIAVAALGKENVTTVGMPGPYSSEGSVRDAEELAKNLGVRFLMLPINEVFGAYRTALAPAFAGQGEDAAEENIQARVRGNLLMALTNRFGGMVLATGNKSELAMGYCTLYGDMAGGLGVIADVPKTMVYELARFLNRGREVIPQETIKKAPSAELRPNQTDQDSLPPYDVLDRILHLYIEELRSPEEIASTTGYDAGLVRDVTGRVDRNEYKRRQSAPGLKITPKALCVGRSFPIVQKFSR